jgi:hypothetical protein
VLRHLKKREVRTKEGWFCSKELKMELVSTKEG